MSSIKSLPPASEVADGEYDLAGLQAPVLTGLQLKLFVNMFESGLMGPLRAVLHRRNGYPQVLEEVFILEEPTFRPNTAGWVAEREGGLVGLPGGGAPAPQRAAAAAQTLAGFMQPPASGGGAGLPSNSSSSLRRRSAADFYRAYLSGEVTPSQVAENVIGAVQHSEAQDPPMRFFAAFDPDHIRQQAAASTQRYARGSPLSPLDGVPFAVKDGCDAPPYPTGAGTAFMAEWRPPTGTSPAVQALLDAGALLLGKASMHEIGIGTTGLNVVAGTPRNPHDVGRHTGGSSSGSAALVAAGVCPFAIGSDGGGSVRIPSALCGLVGLKTTAARVWPQHSPSIDQTVAILGPMAGSVEDCLLMYSVIANAGHPPGRDPPPLRVPAALPPPPSSQPLKGRTAGVYWQWFEDAEPQVVALCKAAVVALEGAGLSVKAVSVPELNALRVAHSCTITSEMRNNMAGVLANPSQRSRLNLETRATLAAAASFTAAQYVQAQKIRTRAEAHFRRVFEGQGCDYLITPAVPCVAPPINTAGLTSGITDIGTTMRLMRFMAAANMLGLPAISVPVGTAPAPRTAAAAGLAAAGAAGAAGGQAGSQGAALCALPVGLQLMAPPWHEASLFLAASVLEGALGEGAVPLPAVHYDVLRPAQQQQQGHQQGQQGQQ